MNKALKLIKLYTHLCELYETELQWEVQRFSNNDLQGEITDTEILTIYFFCTMYEQKMTKKAMHTHILDYWHSWFPTLPCYKVFNTRLNRLADAMQLLAILCLDQFELPQDQVAIMVGDSYPIITCSHKRTPKVALNRIDKGFCATKNLNYFGVKLHTLSFHRKGTLPFPTKIGFTPASVHDLTALRPVLQASRSQQTYLDKAYADKALGQDMAKNGNELLTPIKKVKAKPLILQQFDKAADDLFSTAVSKVRQPIESFFNYLEQKTAIQIASKVRSEQGLIVHIYGKLAAALLILLIF